LLAFSILCPGGAAVAEDETPPDWRKSTFAKELGKETIARLGRQKVLIGPESTLQVFSFYIGSPLPVFITSDSILAAYHVLFEESVVRLERARAAALGEALRQLYLEASRDLSMISLPDGVAAAALHRARAVVGTGLALLGEELPVGDEAVAKIAAAEALRVESAEGSAKPDWLGPPDPGFLALDYARFKPRGFYDRSDSLRRYFRAVSWLQAIPFRVDRDEEFMAWILLVSSLEHSDGGVLRGYRDLLGPGDDPSLADKPRWCGNDFDADDLAEWQAEYRKECKRRVPDQLALPVREATVRILPSAATFDAALFSATTGPLRRSPPDGLEVAAALGSAFARARLEKSAGEKVVEIVGSVPGPQGACLYDRYLRCISALLDAPEPDAPRLFSGEAWRAKSAMTALAGWAQLRHTWTLQSKRNVDYKGMIDTHPGFVEPEPEFFARLARLAEQTVRLLAGSGAFDAKLDRLELAEAIECVARIVERAEIADLRSFAAFAFERLTAEELSAMELASGVLEAASGSMELRKLTDEQRWSIVSELKRLAATCLSTDVPLPEVLEDPVEQMHFDLRAMWERFILVTLRLKFLARKQLRNVPPRREELRFIEDYGETLAGLMFYGGNSWLTPRDDAPRVVDVFHDPNRGKRLHVGIGRPRPLFVLYPWRGREVLCIGGVLPYYEFEAAEPLTDVEWKALLDSENAPKPPAWCSGR